GERYDEWLRVKKGNAHVVIGTRSAVFAPVEKLGLIIMDEEQETSYKSESSPRYHARDIAKYRCAAAKGLLLMGSATPAVESMYLAKAGKYQLYELRKRFNCRALPGVITADMRRELKNGNASDLSEVLAAELEENLRKGQQSILYLNRRGAHSAVLCTECGYSFTCPRCSVAMTSHSANRRLMCHYCGYSEPAPKHCPSCGGDLKYLGTGTQTVEEELQKRFPGVEVIRMDADTVSLAGAHQALLARFRDEKIPILLGTQMIAKGLDIENVTLVGVLNADSGLYTTDFRARERTFNMITQVVGRAGRGSLTGRAVIQSLSPENEVIALAAVQNYDGFYNGEIQLRRAMQAPPFCTRYTITCCGSDETAVLRTAALCHSSLKELFQGGKDRILGPAPAPVTRVNNRYHYRVTICCRGSKEDRNKVGYVLRKVSGEKASRGVLIFADTEV
ncbi:MAG: primosomal protein N', partial [Oscillospiraceae bacterium]|nr:primosomal protein N' [Oscillospiraceae bacterium]